MRNIFVKCSDNKPVKSNMVVTGGYNHWTGYLEGF